MKPLRVLVADADVSVGARVEATLLQSAGLAFVGLASNGDGALDLALSESPDVAFVSCSMPGAAAAAQRILGLTPTPPRVVLISSEVSTPRRRDERSSKEELPDPAGISGYLAEADDAPDVVDVVAALSPLTARAGAARRAALELSDQTRLVGASSLSSTAFPSIARDASTASIMRTTSSPISAEERGTLPVWIDRQKSLNSR
jgi:chemotaxis response regulator CheB